MIEAEPVWTISTRGLLELRRGSERIGLRPKERSVLAAIVLTHPQPIDADRIADLVWDGVPPATARKSIHNHVARIRRAAAGVITTADGRYRLATNVSIDVDGPGVGSGVAFADLPDQPAVLAHRQQVHALISSEEERQLESAVDAGATPDTLARLHAAVAEEPYREHRWYLLASAQATLGQRREALLTFQSARERLADVGLLPGARLQQLEQRVLLGDSASPEPGASTPASSTSAASFHPHRDDPFVGRRQELRRLHRVWQQVVTDSRPHAVIVHGTAGMGKTRLIDRFCNELQNQSEPIRFMWGRHRDSYDRSHGALADSLTRLLIDEPDLATRTGDDTSALWPLVPHLMPDGRSAPTSDDPLWRAQLPRAVRSLLTSVARTPTVWFIDDLQWASPESIDVLVEALDELAGSLLILIASRPADGTTRSGIANIERSIASTAIDLGALTVDELAELLRASSPAAGPPIPDAAAHMVHERTGGLALYASEISRHVRLTSSTIDVDSVPATIRDWVTHHVAALDEDLAEVLELSAAIGQTVDPVLLARCGTDGQRAIARLCDELIRLGFLTLDGSGRHGDPPERGSNLHFSHTITRDIVYEGIGPTMSIQVHRRIADTMLESVADDGRREPDHAALAHHYSRAGADCAERAAHHATLAGEHDLGRGAWTQALAGFELAASLASGPAERAAALAGLGRAHLMAERFDHAAEALRAAIDIARTEDLPDLRATATLALVGRAGRGAAVDLDDAEHIALLRDALDDLRRRAPANQPDAGSAILMSDVERELAFALLLSDAAEERNVLLEQALERVAGLDPPAPAAHATALLGTRYTKLEPTGLAARLADIQQVLAMPAAAVGPEVLLAAYCYQCEDLLRQGDLDGAVEALDRGEVIAGRYPHPYWLWSLRSWRGVAHIIGGELDQAEALAFESFAMRSDIDGAQACLGVNVTNIRLYQGRADEMLPVLVEAIDQYPEVPAYRAVLALCAAESGDLDRAQENLDWFTASNFANLPEDTSRFLGLGALTHVAATLGDRPAAHLLEPLLQPYRDQSIVISCYGGGGAFWGPASHALARLAVLDDRTADAEQLFGMARQQAASTPLALARIESDRASQLA